MQLPNCNEAHVPREKITAYLLLPGHEDASGKAAFFRACGFRLEEWGTLAGRLRNHAAMHSVSTGPRRDAYGNVYTVDGPLRTPTGEETDLPVRSVWIIEHGKDFPRLVTAYPNP
jgi:hypothetical protein